MYVRLLAALLMTLLLGACSTAAQIPAPQPTAVAQPNTLAAASPATRQPTSLPATATVAATIAPTNAPTGAPTAAATQAAPTDAPTANTQPSPAPSTAPAAAESEILFLRGAHLMAYGTTTRAERTLADDVHDFTATPDGRLIALVRGTGLQAELWLVNRDGSGLHQLTHNARAEGTPALAPDGMSVVFTASSATIAPGQGWAEWSERSQNGEVRLLNIGTGEELLLGAGSDPTFSPDGRRIAFATAPSKVDPNADDMAPGQDNAIRLINRKGQNGWNFATASDATPADASLLVYAPAFSPDGTQLSYKRYVGMQVETDIIYTEMGNSFAGKATRIGHDSGWFAPRFSPDGKLMAVTDNFADGQRGWGGYEEWSASVLRPGGSQSVAMPGGQVTLAAEEIARLPRAQHVAWSPDGTNAVVQLPANWQASAPLDQPTYTEQTAGALWRWTPGTDPSQALVTNVDFASPLSWLPPAPTDATHAQQHYGLAYPTGWQLAQPTEFEEITATGAGVEAISAAPTRDAPVATAFPSLVAAGAKEEAPVTWPDGSLYREFSGTSPAGEPVAGAVRVVSTGDAVIMIIYRTTPAQWPIERAATQGLLAASGSR